MQLLVIRNNTKDYFSWESEKMNVKFHKNCESTGEILKISCVKCNFVKFDNHFVRLALLFLSLLLFLKAYQLSFGTGTNVHVL